MARNPDRTTMSEGRNLIGSFAMGNRAANASSGKGQKLAAAGGVKS